MKLFISILISIFSICRAVSQWLVARLSRVTSSGRFIPEIDGLRFIAIIGVVLFHSQGHYFPDPIADPPLAGISDAAAGMHASAWFSAEFFSGINDILSRCIRFVIANGWFGVQLFFIISGFILCTPFAEQHLNGAKKVSLKKYFIRRVTRLEPPYIICMTILFLMAVYWPQHSEYRNQPLEGLTIKIFWDYLASIFYVHNIIYGDGSTINYVAWTLEVEIQFYILAPLFCMLFKVQWRWLRRGIIMALILASVLQREYYFNFHLDQSIIGQVRYFLLGFLLADIYITEWKNAPKKGLAWDIIGVAAWLALPVMFIPTAWLWQCQNEYFPNIPVVWVLEKRNYLLPVILLLSYVAAFRGRIINKFFAHPWIAVIGGMCYTIYLYHMHMIYWVRVMVVEDLFGYVAVGDFPLCFLRLLFASFFIVAVCSIGFVLFEKPFMRRDWPAKVAQFLAWIGLLPARRPEPLPQAVPVEADTETTNPRDAK